MRRGEGEGDMGKGKGVRGKRERLNLFLFPLTFNLFPCLKRCPLQTLTLATQAKKLQGVVKNFKFMVGF
ncbi:hypothetical protein NIES25_31170 [Nostoc linckia NIES-25]|nr:hypothetical protein NIES25_31170 [Nostoc linckia NIES-25]